MVLESPQVLKTDQVHYQFWESVVEVNVEVEVKVDDVHVDEKDVVLVVDVDVLEDVEVWVAVSEVVEVIAFKLER